MRAVPVCTDLELLSNGVGGGHPATEVLGEVAERVLSAKTLLISAHVNPDGDALGSEVALALGLRGLGKEAFVVNTDAVPERFRQFFGQDFVLQVPGPTEAAALPAADLCVLLDTSEPARCGMLKERFFAPDQARVCLDHHVCPQPVAFDAHLVVTESPSTGNLVLALLDRLGVELTREIAEAIWIALATDTGWFRFPNATPWALQDAARLVAAGVPLESLYDKIYGDYSLARVRLQGEVLAAIQTEFDEQFAWSYVSRELLEGSGLDGGELNGLVDSLKLVSGVKVFALIVELDDGGQKVSLRSRGDIDVERIARALGGGGHTKAAGFRFAGSQAALLETLSPFVGDTLR
jgi:phosphoesterase RecJ-like protein